MRTLIALTLTALAGTLAPTSALALDDTGGTACQPLPGMPWAGTFRFVDGQLQPCVGEGASGGEVVVTKLPTFGKEDLYIESGHPKQPTRPAEHRPSCPAFRCMDRDLRPGPDRDLFGFPGAGKGGRGGAGSAKAKQKQRAAERCYALNSNLEVRVINREIVRLKHEAVVLATSLAFERKRNSKFIPYTEKALTEVDLLIGFLKKRLTETPIGVEFLKSGCQRVLGLWS